MKNIFLYLLLLPVFVTAQFNPIFFYQSSAAKQFVSTWNTANAGVSSSTQVKLPLIAAGTYSFTADWGDGSSDNISVWNAAATTHTYASSGTYTIKIKGTCTGWQFNNGGDKLKILTISQWGPLKLGTTQGAYFSGCTNLNISTVTDVLDLTGTTTLSNTFLNCTSLTSVNRISEWNTSAVTLAVSMLQGCTSFNSALAFNFSSATNISAILSGCTVFNNGLSSGTAGTMTWTLNTTSGISLQSIFASCSAFNQNIGGFNVSKVTLLDNAFQNCTVFNNGGSSSIGSWSFGTGLTTLSATFQNCSAFNQPIGSWTISNVTTLFRTFSGATVFNQSLSGWDTGAVTTITECFLNATAFNQNIGGWNVSNVTTAGNFMGSKTAATFSTANLDAIYNGWSALTLKPSVTISFGSAKYTAGSSAGRAILTGAPNNWVITDGGI